MKTFEYKGLTLTAIGNVLGENLTNCMDYRGRFIAPQGYSWEDFRKVAKKNHLFCDVYQIEDKYYVPCNAALIPITKERHNFWKDLKRVEDYSCWYKPAREGE